MALPIYQRSSPHGEGPEGAKLRDQHQDTTTPNCNCCSSLSIPLLCRGTVPMVLGRKWDKDKTEKRPKTRLLSHSQPPISALVPALSLRSGRTLCTSYGKLPSLKAERERQSCWAEGISLPDVPAAAPPSRGVPETQRGPSPG